MNKGKYGIALPALAVLALVLAFFGSWQTVVLLVGFAVILEKNEVLGKQTVAALILALFSSVTNYIVQRIFGALMFILDLADVRDVETLYNIREFLVWGIGLFFVILTIIAIVQVMNGKEVKLPVVSGITNWFFGFVAPKAVYQPQYQQPMQQAVQQPIQQPIQQPMQQVVHKNCPKCGSQVEGKFCAKCGTSMQ